MIDRFKLRSWRVGQYLKLLHILRRLKLYRTLYTKIIQDYRVELSAEYRWISFNVISQMKLYHINNLIIFAPRIGLNAIQKSELLVNTHIYNQPCTNKTIHIYILWVWLDFMAFLIVFILLDSLFGSHHWVKVSTVYSQSNNCTISTYFFTMKSNPNRARV